MEDTHPRNTGVLGGQEASGGEYQALTARAGYRLLDDRVVIRVTGDDRVSFLHGMCSNDIKNLPAKAIVYALFLNEHAHVIADFYAWATEDAILVDADRRLWTLARSHLEKLLVADDVEMEQMDSTVVLDIEGPVAARAIAAPAGGGPEPWRYVERAGSLIGNVPRIGLPAFTILTDREKASEIIGQLRDAIEVGLPALDTVRIENGIARVGVDTGEKTIALEARLERGISFNKGCYVGQETIERATARGALKRRLFGLRVDGARVPEIGAEVSLSGREVGQVSSAALSPRMGVLALSILHHSAWTAGAAVQVADRSGGLKAVVADLPFG